MRKLLEYQADRIEAVLQQHHVTAQVTGGTVTPRWVRFQVLPAVGTRISSICNLSEELAAALDVTSVRVARQGAAVNIEVPREDAQPVRLLPLWQGLKDVPPVTATLGLTDDGAPLLIRLSSPDVAHILVSGTTGSGKTALMRTIVLSLVMRHQNGGLALVLIDPKGGLAFGPFDGLPHLARPVIREVAAAREALRSLVRLMEQRARRGESDPAVVVVIDELVDLLMVDRSGETEHCITRLAQRGREAGIHLIAATQKPTAAAVGTLVKANFPVRLVGKVASAEDARVASGWKGSGAERLLGRGDFVAVAEGQLFRFQAAYVSPEELDEALTYLGRATLPAPEQPPLLEAGLPCERWAAMQVVPLPDPPEPELDIVDVMMQRLQSMGWAGNSYRDACRALGEAEGGRRFDLVREAVDRLRDSATATATTNRKTSPDGENETFGSGSTVAVAGRRWAPV